MAAAALLLVLLGAAGDDLQAQETPGNGASHDGRRLYGTACASCHGVDGTGASRSRVGFSEPLPDFTDCSFATREPDGDWLAVTHQGGPVRGFARMMPAFGDALSMEELQAILGHVRSFCGDEAWPRGELNLPRPLVTEKAYPEDEAVITTTVSAEGRGSVTHELVYERRFGSRNQVEVSVPFGWRERVREGAVRDATDWTGGMGDLGIGVKRAVHHSLEEGRILSLGGEVVVPSGDEDDGFGAGTTIFEPFVSFGQILPSDAFLHGQGVLELPADTDRTGSEALWRIAVGKSFTAGRWGRTWSPMVEVLGSRELRTGGETRWDLVPQLQVTLNRRQHVMANAGVRIPLDETASRDAEVLIYVLWDWFDGGLFAGW
jgi:mono/diheme cytochrome c family protein